MTRRLLISILIMTLLGITGAKVSALWSQQKMSPLRTDYSLGTNNLANIAWQSTLSEQQWVLLERLNARLQRNADDFEAGLLKGLLLFQSGKLTEAITELQSLTTRAPKFQLAHLILGDLLLARFDQVGSLGSSSLLQNLDSKQAERVDQLRREARARLEGYLSLVKGVEVPIALLSLSNSTEYALIVDKSKNRLYVYRNLGAALPPELVDDFYIVLGKEVGDKFQEGDLRTPNGVYFVTSFLPDEILPPLYGSGAFPVNYPNEIDRRLKKTGNGIWLHGTDKEFYSRPPLDTEGCVVLTNEEFKRIDQYIEVGRTPVVISEAVEWYSSQNWFDRNIEIQATLERWRQSWEATDIDSYLNMYADDFWAKGHDSQSWGRYKKRVFAGKTFQKIDLSDISLLSYPGVTDGRIMVVANFRQKYRSNNYNGDMRKRLYMAKEDGQWKVLYEGRQ